ncbi:MAG: acyl-CoA thioesterase [Pseudomonadota bacterium]|nr:acyl-CoA thioesterase [Pseudomonadota bacterium]
MSDRSATGWLETYRGVVYPWQCDHMGHLNAMFYTNIFDQSLTHLMAACGYRFSPPEAAHLAYVNVRQLVDYVGEQRAGARMLVRAGVLRRGRSSIVTLHRLLNAETGALAATAETTTVHFDLKARLSVPLRAETLALIDGRTVDPEAA